jgi:endogenous inhibitor of DNA gyrase (YacG/DUF329 family)
MIWWPGSSERLCFSLQAENFYTKTVMARKRSVKVRCPICKKAVERSAADFPFCSERCRTIDLGKWATGGYVISSPVKDAEELIQDQGPEDQDRDR